MEKEETKKSKVESTEIKKCDSCSKPFTGRGYPMFDENYNVQAGLKQCENCYIDAL